MKVKDLIEKGYKLLTNQYMDKLNEDIGGVYICDLLSWVMSHAKTGDVWITVQVHVNIVAVALLTGVSCIIIPEGISVNEDTLKRADKEGIPILSIQKPSYEASRDIDLK